MKKEKTKPETQSEEHLMKKFTTSVSKAEIQKTADKIVALEHDIDKGNLEEAKAQFHQEKREDAAKEAQNEAQFEQPKV